MIVGTNLCTEILLFSLMHRIFAWVYYNHKSGLVCVSVTYQHCHVLSHCVILHGRIVIVVVGNLHGHGL